MDGHTYKVIEVVGSSSTGISEAIESAIDEARKTIKGLNWFEVGEIRGQVSDEGIAWYQVAVKIGFRVMSDEELGKTA